MAYPPAFLITVDTEGDNLWAKPRAVETRNARFLPRFQRLCETHGLRPTYLTNWEMAHAAEFVEFGRDILTRGAGEIGMHLHAWNSPPIVPLTADDDRFAPYLIEYPEPQMREKIKTLTAKLENAFGERMVSHRAGRWSFNEIYARILVEQGYLIDCSVTPHVSWQYCKGDPSQSGGSDYTEFPDSAYFLDPENIRRPGASPLLELPMTLLRTRRHPWPIESLRKGVRSHFYGTVLMRKLFPYYAWLMPNGRNRQSMLRIIATAVRENRPYIELAIHSSELMPGGSPTFATQESIERLYEDLIAVFDAATAHFSGCTLKEYRGRFA